jgi:ribonuclease HI
VCRNASLPLPGPLQTNQRAELSAALEALRRAPDVAPLEIRTDSMYTIRGAPALCDSLAVSLTLASAPVATIWLAAWKHNGWKTQAGDVKNRDLVTAIDAALDCRRFPVHWVHVRGHSGDRGNDMADRLAVRGSLMRD